MRESRRWLGCRGRPDRSTKSEVEAPATRKHYGSNSSAYVTFQQTHMRSTILVRSTIHTRAVLLSIDQYVDMHQHFHSIIIWAVKGSGTICTFSFGGEIYQQMCDSIRRPRVSSFPRSQQVYLRSAFFVHALCCRTKESSHGRGAAQFSELLT